jgi:iron complex outermembrane receptor protein
LSADLSVYYSGAFYYEPTYLIRTNSFTTLGARVSYKPANTTVKFSLCGKNLTNNANINSALPSAAGNAVSYAPPREMGATVEYSF